MTRAISVPLSLYLALALVLALAACATPATLTVEDEAGTTDADSPVVTTGDAADVTSPPEAEQDDAGADQTAEDLPTPDPTVQALVAGFELPVRGDADAPLLIYEFSDYL